MVHFTCDHDASNVGIAQLADNGCRLGFQRVVHDEEAEELEMAFHLVAFHSVHLMPREPAIEDSVGHGQDTIPAHRVTAENGGKVGRDRGLGATASDHLRRAFD